MKLRLSKWLVGLCELGLAAQAYGCSSDAGKPAVAAEAGGSSGAPSATSGAAGAAPSSVSGAAAGGVSGAPAATGNAGAMSDAGESNGGSGLVPFQPPQCAEGSSTALPASAPELTVGSFVDISPPGVPFDSNATAITQGMTIDPCNPATIYVCVGDQEHGIYRSSDGGGTVAIRSPA